MKLTSETRRGVVAGLLVCIPVGAVVVGTVFALEKWWPTTHSGIIAGLAGSITFLIGLLLILKLRH